MPTYYFSIGFLIAAAIYIFLKVTKHPAMRLNQALLTQDIKQLKLALSEISKDDIDFPIKSRQSTTLYTAIQDGNIEIVNLLIQAGADINFGFNIENGWNSILKAVIARRYDIIELLMKNQAMVGIHFYAFQGNVAKIEELLLENLQSVDVINTGLTPLCFAVIGESLESINLLLQKNANINIYTSNYGTPLAIAIRRKNTDIINFLIDSGAKIQHDIEPLNIAISQGSLQICELLIQRGASVNSLHRASYSPLHLAASLGKVEIASLLIESGAIVDNFRSDDNETPLCQAIRNSHLAMVELLIHYGANINISVGDFLLVKGRTPLGLSRNHTYSRNTMLKIENLLLQYGATNYGFEE